MSHRSNSRHRSLAAAGMCCLAALAISGCSDTDRTTAQGPAIENSVDNIAGPQSSASSPTATPALSQQEKKRLDDTRKSAELGTVDISKAVPRVERPIKDLTVSESNNLDKGRTTLKVVSARSDLTGQRELGWVTDKGETVGSSHCTQKIKLSNNKEAAVRPNLLLCWRTSARKSVYALMVNLDGKPSKLRAVAAVDREWSKLR